MKKIIGILLIAATVIFAGCEGIPGPPGPQGQDGIDGTALIGTVFEIEGDFTPGNNYTLYYEFPKDFEIYATDVVLVYILWEVDGDLDIWRLLPQTIVLNDGLLQYNFDYTVADVQVFMEGSTDFNKLRPAETDNQIFRIAVLPADFMASNKSVDVNDFNSIKNSPEINLLSIDNKGIEGKQLQLK